MWLFTSRSHEYSHSPTLRAEQLFILEAWALCLDFCFVPWRPDSLCHFWTWKKHHTTGYKIWFPKQCQRPMMSPEIHLKIWISGNMWKGQSWQTDFLSSLPSMDCPSLSWNTQRQTLSVQLLGDGRWPGRKHLPLDEACLSLGYCGLQQAGNCTSNCILTFATSFPIP